MQGLISVIIPVYNTGELLNRCVESIINQTYSDIEIILVDDGSNDYITAKICDELSHKNECIHCMHKENGGQSTARNAGLEIAKGDYIAFVDSDDWIDSNMYSILMENMIRYNADISCCNTGISLEADTKRIIEFRQPEMMKEHLFDHKGTGHSPCDKLYKAELFHNIRFFPIRAYEDCATIFKLFSNAKKIVYEDITLYHYEQRENSTMTQLFSSIKFDAISAYYEMYQFYSEKYPEYTAIVKAKLIGSIQYCVGETLLLDLKEELGERLEFAKTVLKKIGVKNTSIKHKLSIFLILHCEKLFRLAYCTKHKDY